MGDIRAERATNLFGALVGTCRYAAGWFIIRIRRLRNDDLKKAGVQFGIEKKTGRCQQEMKADKGLKNRIKIWLKILPGVNCTFRPYEIDEIQMHDPV